jgi:hypothetical protein
LPTSALPMPPASYISARFAWHCYSASSSSGS